MWQGLEFNWVSLALDTAPRRRNRRRLVVSPLPLHHLLFPPISPSLFSLSHSYLHLDIILEGRAPSDEVLSARWSGLDWPNDRPACSMYSTIVHTAAQPVSCATAAAKLSRRCGRNSRSCNFILILLPCSWISFEAIMIIALWFLLWSVLIFNS